MTTLKTCSRCESEFDTSAFHRRAASPDGLQPFCKSCATIRNRENRERYKQKNNARDPRAETSTKRCPQCETEKPSVEFALHAARPDGLADVCSKCSRVGHRAYYEEHREGVLARNAQWAAENPERMAEIKREAYEREKANGKRHTRNLAKFNLTPVMYSRLLEAQGGICAICGKEEVTRRLHVDHDHDTGLVRGLLCGGCNGPRIGRLGDFCRARRSPRRRL